MVIRKFIPVSANFRSVRKRLELAADRKAANWKAAIAARLKETMLCRNGWLAERLGMGCEYSVSRYVSEPRSRRRDSARKPRGKLVAKVKE